MQIHAEALQRITRQLQLVGLCVGCGKVARKELICHLACPLHELVHGLGFCIAECAFGGDLQVQRTMAFLQRFHAAAIARRLGADGAAGAHALREVEYGNVAFSGLDRHIK